TISAASAKPTNGARRSVPTCCSRIKWSKTIAPMCRSATRSACSTATSIRSCGPTCRFAALARDFSGVRDRFLWTGCAVYAALFFWLGLAKYAVHRNLVDFGIFAQTIASAFGCFCNPLEGSHWAFHFSPILYAVAMAVALVHAPGTLIALQAVAG